jgi:TolB protein
MSSPMNGSPTRTRGRCFLSLAVVTVATWAAVAVLAAPAAAPAVHPVPPGGPAPPWLGTTTSILPSMSADGRFVVFTAYSPDSEAGDVVDILLRDRRRGVTTTIVHSTPDIQHFGATISADGDRVAYLERFPANEGNAADLYVLDRGRGRTTFEGQAYVGSQPSLSADGGLVTFERQAADGNTDVYVRDVDRDSTTLVSVSTSGAGGNGSSGAAEISADGRVVLFSSVATNLTPEPPAGDTLYLRDLRGRTTTAYPLAHGTGSSWGSSAALSPDGRYAAYSTDQVWLLDLATGTSVAVTPPQPDDVHSSLGDVSARARVVAYSTTYDIREGGEPYTLMRARTMRTGTEELINVGTGGPQTSRAEYLAEITPSGRYVAFHSDATNLVPGDTNGVMDVFIRDLVTDTTTLVSTR